MNVFRSIIFSAAFAGLLVGMFVTIAQHFGTIPLIQRAEQYERQAEAQGHQHSAEAPNFPAEAADAVWQPTDGFERNAYTALFNVVEWIGFGLLLNGAMVLLRRPFTWREGLLWGLGGFVAFVVAPGIGLPPELPGIPAAPLLSRQLWWATTAGATAAGLGLLAFGRSISASVVAILIIAAPHLFGAPQLEHAETAIPEFLSRRFVVAVTLTALVGWALLGGLTGHFYRKFSTAS
jgi:cobalt transporter subunit CbtA